MSTDRCRKIDQQIEWTKERVMIMIDNWMEHECLYNPNHRNYHIKRARNDALARIANSLLPNMPNVTPNDVKTKINSLRSQFCREVNKLKDFIQTNEGVENIYTPHPYWFQKLNTFLSRFVRVQKGKYDDIDYETFDESSSQCMTQGSVDDSLSDNEMTPPSKRTRSNDRNPLELSPSEFDDSFVKTEPKIKKRKRPQQQEVVIEEIIVHDPNENNLRITSTSTDNTPNQWRETAKKTPKPTKIPTSTKQVPSSCSNEEYDAAFLNFIKVNLAVINDVALKDELTDKITGLLLDYKRKQRSVNST